MTVKLANYYGGTSMGSTHVSAPWPKGTQGKFQLAVALSRACISAA